MTATAFVLPAPEVTDAQERDELARLTGSLTQPTSDAQLDAVASDALRVMSEEEAEITRYRKALAAEVQRILSRYGVLITPHEKRRAQAQSLVEECATRAQFVGKAKSRKVGNGSYGKRQIPESVKILDLPVLLPWLKNHYPALITSETVEKVAAKDLKPVVISHMKLYEGEIVPGVEYTEAHDKPFASPLEAK